MTLVDDLTIGWLAASNEYIKPFCSFNILLSSNLAATFLATLRIAFSYMHIAHLTLSTAKASVTHCALQV